MNPNAEFICEKPRFKNPNRRFSHRVLLPERFLFLLEVQPKHKDYFYMSNWRGLDAQKQIFIVCLTFGSCSVEAPQTEVLEEKHPGPSALRTRRRKKLFFNIAAALLSPTVNKHSQSHGEYVHMCVCVCRVVYSSRITTLGSGPP